MAGRKQYEVEYYGLKFDVDAPDTATEQDIRAAVENYIGSQLQQSNPTPRKTIVDGQINFDPSLPVRDLGLSVAGGAVDLAKSISSVLSGDESDLTKYLARKGEEIQSRKSLALQQKERDLQERVSKKESEILNEYGNGIVGKSAAVLGSMLETAKGAAQDPHLLLSTIGSSLPSTLASIGPGFATRLALSGVGKVAPHIAATNTFKAIKNTAPIASAVGAGAVLQGLDVRRNTYEDAMSQPEEVWLQNPEYVELAQKIGSEAAKQQIASELASGAGKWAGAASIGSSLLPGGRSLESILLKKGMLRPGTIVRHVAGETTQEAVEGGSGKYASNVYLRDINPEIDPISGVGYSAGIEAVAGAGITAGAHGARSAIEKTKSIVNARKLDAQPSEAEVALQDQGGAQNIDIDQQQNELYKPSGTTAADILHQIETELKSPETTTQHAAALKAEQAALLSNMPKATLGNETVVQTELGDAVGARYAIMDIKDLVASHDIDSNLSQAYPGEMRRQDIDQIDHESRVQEIVSGFDPQKLIGGQRAAEGAPVVGPDGVVEAGSARINALMRVYQANGAKADQYRTTIQSIAPSLGIDPEAVSRMQTPVLVRLRTTPVNRQEMVKRSNTMTAAIPDLTNARDISREDLVSLAADTVSMLGERIASGEQLSPADVFRLQALSNAVRSQTDESLAMAARLLGFNYIPQSQQAGVPQEVYDLPRGKKLVDISTLPDKSSETTIHLRTDDGRAVPVKAKTISRTEAENIRKLVSDVFGLNVKYVTNASRRLSEWDDGMYNRATPGTIYLSVETVSAPHQAVLGHEIFHAIKNYAPDIASIVEERVKEFAKKNAISKFQRYYGEQLPTDVSIEEIAADLFGNRVIEPGFWENLFAELQDKTLIERVVHAIRKFVQDTIARIDAILHGNIQKGYRTDLLIVRDKLDEIRNAVMEAAAKFAKQRHGMAQAPSGAEVMASKARDMGDVNITAEIVPSIEVADIANLSLAEKAEFTKAAQKIILDTNGKNALANKLGISMYKQIEGTGGYEGKTSPIIITSMPEQRGDKKQLYDYARLYALSWMYIYRQNAVPFMRVAEEIDINDIDGENARRIDKRKESGEEMPTVALGTIFKFSEPLTAEKEDKFFESLRAALGDDAGYTKVDDKTIIVANFRSGEDGQPFAMSDNEYIQRINSMKMPEWLADIVEKVSYKAIESEYPYHSWEGDQDGKALEDSIHRIQNQVEGRPGGQDFIEWLRNRRATFDAITRQWEKQHNAPGGRGAGETAVENVLRSAIREYGQAKEGSVSVLGVHYSALPRQTLDSSKYGTGARGAEYSRVMRSKDKRLRHRIYFYIPASISDLKPESGVGQHPHYLFLNNLYDAGKDSYIQKSIKASGSPEEYANAFESAVLDAGFDGYIGAGRATDGSRIAVLLGERIVEVTPSVSGAIENDLRVRVESLPEKEIVNKLPPSAKTPYQKVVALRKMTKENVPIVSMIMHDINRLLGTKSFDNIKSASKIIDKAKRPSILKKKPWFGVEHIRDSYRFMTEIDNVDQIHTILNVLRMHNVGIVEADFASMYKPKELGWRMIALDLRMPNGQIVEYQAVLREMQAVKGAGHKIYEKWRNKNLAQMTSAEIEEYKKDILISKNLFDTAYERALSRSGTSPNAVLASLINAAALVRSYSGENSDIISPSGRGYRVHSDSPENLTAKNLSEKDITTTSPSLETSTLSSIRIHSYPDGSNVIPVNMAGEPENPVTVIPAYIAYSSNSKPFRTYEFRTTVQLSDKARIARHEVVLETIKLNSGAAGLTKSDAGALLGAGYDAADLGTGVIAALHPEALTEKSATDVVEEWRKIDAMTQAEWLTERASAKGYASLDEYLAKAPSEFMADAELWRAEHPIEPPDLRRSSLRSTDKEAQQKELYARIVAWAKAEQVNFSNITKEKLSLYRKVFGEAVRELKSIDERISLPIPVRPVTEAMRIAKIPSQWVVAHANIVQKISTKHGEDFKLGPEQLFDLLENPIAIFKSGNGEDYELITTERANGNPIMIAIRPDMKEFNASIRWTTVKSAYSKPIVDIVRQNRMNGGRLVYLDQGAAENALTKKELNALLSARSMATKSPKPAVMASRGRVPDYVLNAPPIGRSAYQKTGAKPIPPTIGERIRALKEGAVERFVQGMFDTYAPIKKIGDRQYMLARLASSADGALETLIMHGRIELDRKTGVIKLKSMNGGLMKILTKTLEGDYYRWLHYMAGQRALQLLDEGRERNLTREEAEYLVTENAEGTLPSGRSRREAFEQAAKEFARLNNDVLDIAVASGLISKKERNEWAKNIYYVPFYRMLEDEKYNGPRTAAGMVNQWASKKLKGGPQATADLMENILRNWSHLINASLRNQAAAETLVLASRIGAAHRVAEKHRGDVTVKIGGMDFHYRIDDPLLADSLKASATYAMPGMQVLRTFKRWLTLGATISPTFKIRNLIRDTITAVGTNDISWNVFKNLADGWSATKHGSRDYVKMLASGGAMRFGTYLEGDRAAHIQNVVNKALKNKKLIDTPQKAAALLSWMWDRWQEIGDRSENINRAAIWKQVLDKTGDELLAAFAARDAMDFSLQGKWAAIRILGQVVPFFNARLQGLYKLGRAAKYDPRRLGAVLMAVSAASVFLLLAQGDDDWYKELEDWERDTFWWIKLPDWFAKDVIIAIPKPFEIGAFGTMVERAVETLIRDDVNGKDYAKALLRITHDQLSMNPIPQAFLPLIELYTNKSFFTGRDIETMGMERMSKENRVAPYTSATAQVIGKYTSFGTYGLSPVQIDHIARGYFGWLGAHIMMASDMIVAPLTDRPAPAWLADMTGTKSKPTSKIDDYFVIGDFVKSLPRNRSKVLTDFYEQAKEAEAVMADIGYYRRIGDAETLRKVIQEENKKIALAPMYNKISGNISTINRQIDAVMRSNMSAEEKRRIIDSLYQQRLALARAALNTRKAINAQ